MKKITTRELQPGQVLECGASEVIVLLHAASTFRITPSGSEGAQAVFLPQTSGGPGGGLVLLKVIKGLVAFQGPGAEGVNAWEPLTVTSNTAFAYLNKQQNVALEFNVDDNGDTTIVAIKGGLAYGLIKQQDEQQRLDQGMKIVLPAGGDAEKAKPEKAESTESAGDAVVEYVEPEFEATTSTSSVTVSEDGKSLIIKSSISVTFSNEATKEENAQASAATESSSSETPDQQLPTGHIPSMPSSAAPAYATPTPAPSTAPEPSAPSNSSAAAQPAFAYSPPPADSSPSGDPPTVEEEVVTVTVEFDPSQFDMDFSDDDSGSSGVITSSSSDSEEDTESPFAMDGGMNTRVVKPQVNAIVIGGNNVMGASGATLRFRKQDLENGTTLTLGGSLEENENVVRVEISLDGGITWFVCSGTMDWEYSFDPVGGMAYNLMLRITSMNGQTFDFELGRAEKTIEQVPAPELTAPPRGETLQVCGQHVDPYAPGIFSLSPDSLPDGVFTVSGSFDEETNNVVGVEVSVDGGASWRDAAGLPNWEFSYTPAPTEEIDLALRYMGPYGESITRDMSQAVVYEPEPALEEPPALSFLEVCGQSVNPSAGGARISPADLQDGVLTVRGGLGSARDDITSVEVSVDGGSTWQQANGVQNWEFTHTPTSDEEIELAVRYTNERGESVVDDLGDAVAWEPEPVLEEPPRMQSLLICGQAVDPNFITPGSLNFTRDDLEDGVLTLQGSHTQGESTISKVEVSVDGGSTWEETDGVDNWSYSYTPSGDEEIELAIRYTSPTGDTAVDDFSGGLVMEYLDVDRADLLQETFDEQIEAYTGEDIHAFLQSVSAGFTSAKPELATTALLENSMRNDFANTDAPINPSELQYRIASTEVADDGSTAQVDMDWNNSITGEFRSSCTMHYVWEDGQWKLREISGEPPFGTYAELNTPDSIVLSLSQSSIVVEDIETVNVNVIVYNQYGDPLPEATVDFKISPASAGALDRAQETTDTSGAAAVTFTTEHTYADTVNVTITATCGKATDTKTLELITYSPPVPTEGDL